MTAPYTVLLHGISGGISLFIFLWIEIVFRRRSHAAARGQEGSSPASHYFAWWFLFYFLYYVFLTLPLVLSAPIDTLNWFYTAGLASIFFGSFYIIRVPFDTLFVRRPSVLVFASALLLGFLLGIVLLQVLFPIDPYLVSAERLLIWNPHPVAGAAITWGLVAVALLFAAMFFVGAKRARNGYVKVRSVFFGFGAVLLALSAKYYYQAGEALEVFLGILFGIAGIVMLALGLVIVESLKRRNTLISAKHVDG